jgi:hypothetical protein
MIHLSGTFIRQVSFLIPVEAVKLDDCVLRFHQVYQTEICFLFSGLDKFSNQSFYAQLQTGKVFNVK